MCVYVCVHVCAYVCLWVEAVLSARASFAAARRRRFNWHRATPCSDDGEWHVWVCVCLYQHFCVSFVSLGSLLQNAFSCISIFVCLLFACVCSCVWFTGDGMYGLATISRLLKIIGLFCKRALLSRRYSAKETYNFKELTYHGHSISAIRCITMAFIGDVLGDHSSLVRAVDMGWLWLVGSIKL